MINIGYKKLWILRRLKNLGANHDELKLIYQQHVRCVVEFSTPVWAGAVTQEQSMKIERIQKCALRIILGEEYVNYENALHKINIESLKTRRKSICLRFAKKASQHDRFHNWFVLNETQMNTRSDKLKYKEVKGKKKGLKRCPIAYLTKLLNEEEIVT